MKSGLHMKSQQIVLQRRMYLLKLWKAWWKTTSDDYFMLCIWMGSVATDCWLCLELNYDFKLWKASVQHRFWILSKNAFGYKQWKEASGLEHERFQEGNEDIFRGYIVFLQSYQGKRGWRIFSLVLINLQMVQTQYCGAKHIWSMMSIPLPLQSVLKEVLFFDPSNHLKLYILTYMLNKILSAKKSKHVISAAVKRAALIQTNKRVEHATDEILCQR